MTWSRGKLRRAVACQGEAWRSSAREARAYRRAARTNRERFRTEYWAAREAEHASATYGTSGTSSAYGSSGTYGTSGASSGRECDVLKASVDGATVADIAARLHLSVSTVRNYLSSAIGKTGTRNRMEAMREARQQGWL